MAELHQKRLREAPIEDSNSTWKRQKPPYESIINLLDDEDEDGDPNMDFSAILTSFQQELESPSSVEEIPLIPGESETESIMRRLLEASDDELGIPNGTNDKAEVIEDNMNFGIDENPLWKLEDEENDFFAVPQQEQKQFQEEEEFLM